MSNKKRNAYENLIVWLVCYAGCLEADVRGLKLDELKRLARAKGRV